MLTGTRTYQVLSWFGVFLVALSFAVLAPSQVARAATIFVNTTADELNVNGNCSLREAIQAANTDAGVDACVAGSGSDTIMVPAGTYVLSLPGTGENANATGDLDITSDLTIVGSGASATIIDGARLDRVFHVAAGVTAEISGVTIQNGLAPFEGGLATLGGGILNLGMLTLNGCLVRGNTGVALDHFGGGIYTDGTLTLINSTVSDNAAVGGGGIYIFVHGTAALSSSTVSGNQAGAFGGGIQNQGILLTIENSTISGNFAGSSGAGIQGGVTAITNSTVTANSAGFGGFGGFGAGIANSLIQAKNTIVGKNLSGGDCVGVATTSLGHNLDSDGTCGFTAPGDISNADPRLGTLADNGGPTKTHALLAGSPATDAGSLDCPPPSTDQRGVRRPKGVACDIGSFERVPPLAFLHGTSSTLFLDGNAPTLTTPIFRDSPSLKFSGGNPWKEIGVWSAVPARYQGTLNALTSLEVWLGLKNSDDSGTRFDLRAEVFKNGTLVTASETLCITSVTRNPALAKQVTGSFGAFEPIEFDGATDVLSVRVLTRIGTNGAGGHCGGHSNAVGLRLYFDATSRSSNFDGSFAE